MPYSFINDAVAQSLEMSLINCKRQFEWDRWNCPTEDFLAKRSTPNFDRESAYVQAITIASLIFTLSRNCSIIAEQEVGHRKAFSVNCSSDLDTVDRVVQELFEYGGVANLDIQSFAETHNNRAGRIVSSI